MEPLDKRTLARRRAYVLAMRRGGIPRPRADLVRAYRILHIVRAMGLQVKPVKGIELCSDDEEVRRPRAATPVPDQLLRAPFKDKERWRRMVRCTPEWLAKNRGRPTVGQMEFYRRYGLLEEVKLRGFDVSEPQLTLAQCTARRQEE